MDIIWGILIPFIGTMIGSFMVFFMRNKIENKIEKLLLGFAAGVMIAASIWSLLLPSIDMALEQGFVAWFPASFGFILGIIFLFVLKKIIAYFSLGRNSENGTNLEKTVMMMIAVTLHNIPEGMAVGVVFAGFFHHQSLVSLMGAYSLSIGIGIQNFPEGAIISMPLRSKGCSKFKSFIYGVLSGIVEPISAILTFYLTSMITVILPYLLSFAAGAMIYVVVDELIPESQYGKHSGFGMLGVTIGFVMMMILDVSLG